MKGIIENISRKFNNITSSTSSTSTSNETATTIKNGITLFQKQMPSSRIAVFGGGCFWGLQKYFDDTDFCDPNNPNNPTKSTAAGIGLKIMDGRVLRSFVGYVAGNLEYSFPSYEMVCTGQSGYAEALIVEYCYDRDVAAANEMEKQKEEDKANNTAAAAISNANEEENLKMVEDPIYEGMLDLFWKMHDPTTLNRQGNDAGTQYRSIIVCESEVQFKAAKRSRDKVQAEHYDPLKRSITTEIRLEKDYSKVPFYIAEAYHQNYLKHNPGGYCNHRLRW